MFLILFNIEEVTVDVGLPLNDEFVCKVGLELCIPKDNAGDCEIKQRDPTWYISLPCNSNIETDFIFQHFAFIDEPTKAVACNTIL